MANPTTNYGFVLPTSTDLVTDLPADFDVALQGVDTRLKALQPGTTLGDLMYASATANTNTRLGIGSTGNVLTVTGGVPVWSAPASGIPANDFANVATSQTTTSDTYTDLATSGPAVTVTTGTKVLVIVSAQIENGNGTGQAYMDYAVSGATSRSAADATALGFEQTTSTAGQFVKLSSANALTVTAGSNTFTAKYRRGSEGTATFSNRQIFVINLA